jgi:hypothetical protein
VKKSQEQSSAMVEQMEEASVLLKISGTKEIETKDGGAS